MRVDSDSPSQSDGLRETYVAADLDVGFLHCKTAPFIHFDGLRGAGGGGCQGVRIKWKPEIRCRRTWSASVGMKKEEGGEEGADDLIR